MPALVSFFKPAAARLSAGVGPPSSKSHTESQNSISEMVEYVSGRGTTAKREQPTMDEINALPPISSKGLHHEFWLLRAGEWSFHLIDTTSFLNAHTTRLIVHDSIIMYINDTLQWIQTSNPARKDDEPHYGLNLYGPTIITKEGAESFRHVFETWARMFEKGPATFQLTGDWIIEYDDDGNEKKRGYEILTIDKDNIIKTFRRLAEYAEHIEKDDYFILHFGL